MMEPGDNSGESDEDEVKKVKKTRRKRKKLCLVCGDKALSVPMYGCPASCNACLAFYRLNRFAEQSVKKCRTNGQCPVTKKTRTNCQRCRFQKCIQMGMNLTQVRGKQQKKREKRAQQFADEDKDGFGTWSCRVSNCKLCHDTMKKDSFVTEFASWTAQERFECDVGPCLYLISCTHPKCKGFVYVGESKDLRSRIRDHRSAINKSRRTSPMYTHFLDEHPGDWERYFTFTVLEKLPTVHNKAYNLERENLWIQFFRSWDIVNNGLNDRWTPPEGHDPKKLKWPQPLQPELEREDDDDDDSTNGTKEIRLRASPPPPKLQKFNDDKSERAKEILLLRIEKRNEQISTLQSKNAQDLAALHNIYTD